ncbi:TetR/AcrR family transcriptional regulator [Actinacidiphila rubida]|uniref:Transcriptional regulator, TetR family n=1 Tax=Actinacidiphila rubida TaxID=310780 RepID=A0A1H8F265_9ACTN|nr:TetR/AcrR family transcriptional regulator [Actinacidiphila rubida]SEN25981.1 transcriptional regulator, TetR family [Actinacidiphila rubida]
MTITADTTEATPRRAPRMRTDAARNRERILAAAREMLVEQGLDVPFDDIARRAGVGNATLYRHFPDRHALLRAVLLFVMTRTADFAETVAAEEPDPFTALCGFAHAALDERAAAICALFPDKERPEATPEMYAAYARFQTALDGLMERAREAGQLREDITPIDFMIAVSQLSRPLPGLDCDGAGGHRRVGLFLDGLHPRSSAGTPTTHHPEQPRSESMTTS